MVGDKGLYFVGWKLKSFYEELNIEYRFASVRHANRNEQVEAANKVVGHRKELTPQDEIGLKTLKWFMGHSNNS